MPYFLDGMVFVLVPSLMLYTVISSFEEAATRSSPWSSKSRDVTWEFSLMVGNCFAGRYWRIMSETFCWEEKDIAASWRI